MNAHRLAEEFSQSSERAFGELLARIKPMRDVDMARLAEVAHEHRRTPRHVRRQDRRRITQSDRPPRAPILSDVTGVGACPSRLAEEAVHPSAIASFEQVEVHRKIYDAP